MLVMSVGCACAEKASAQPVNPIEGVDFYKLQTDAGARASIFKDIDEFWGPNTPRLLNGVYNLLTVGATDAPLCCLGGPYRGPAAYFEHIYNGAAKDNHRSRYTPETDPKHFQNYTGHAISLVWPQEGSSWDVQCRSRYTLHNDGIGMNFHVTFPNTKDAVRDIAPHDWIAFMHASYTVSMELDRSIRFIGKRGRRRTSRLQWIDFGKDNEAGAIGYLGTRNPDWDSGADVFNVRQKKGVHFWLPMYYSTVIPAEESEEMLYAMFFNKARNIRFAIHGTGGGQIGSPVAYDWQLIVRNPKPGKTYGYKAFLLYEPVPESITTQRQLDRYVLLRWAMWRISLRQ